MTFKKPDIILEVFEKSSGELILVLLKHGNKISISFVIEVMRETVEKWIQKGFRDTVGENPNQIRRFTPSSHSDFIDRVAEYLNTSMVNVVTKITKK